MRRCLLLALMAVVFSAHLWPVPDADAGRGRLKGGRPVLPVGPPVEPPEPPPPTGPCTYLASPTGTGNGITAPFKIGDFWAVAAAGDVLCLETGTYTGSTSMITPPPGLSFPNENRVTIRALTPGGAVLDGQYDRDPLRLSGNSGYVFEDFNAKRGRSNVIFTGGGSNNLTFRRLVAWDTDITRQTQVVWVEPSANVLLEDVAAFGTGSGQFFLQGSSATSPVICRRCWGRWEGSTSNVMPKITSDGLYQAPHTGVRHENSLMTWSGESMPQTYTITRNGVNDPATTNPTGCSPGTGTATNFAVTCPTAIYRVVRGTGTNHVYNARIYGSLAYLRQADIFKGGNIGLIAMPGGGAVASGIHLRDVVAFAHPSNADFGVMRGFRMQQATGSTPTDLSAQRISSVRGASDVVTTSWSTSQHVQGTSLAAIPNPWTTTTGANLCKRWTPGGTTPSTVPLWPWPMRDRIKAATAAAGAYNGPCRDCSGGRFARTETDVQAQVAALLGAIPAACGG